MFKSNFAKQEISSKEVIDFAKSLKHRGFLLLSLIVVSGMLVGVFWGIIPLINQIKLNYQNLKTEVDNTTTLANKKRQVETISTDSDFANAYLVNEVLYSDNPFMPMMFTLDQTRINNQLPAFVRQELSPGLVATPSAEFANLRRSQQSNANRLASKKDAEGFTIFLEVRGSYLNLVNFLHDLENSAPYNSVAYSEITNSLNGNASARLEILSQYYPPQIAAKLITPIPALSAEDKETLRKLARVNKVDLSRLNQADFIDYNRLNPFRQLEASSPTIPN